jgi:hypothetical protein
LERLYASLHMKSADSRLILRIEDVRAEKCSEISEADCLAEGIVPGKRYAIMSGREWVSESQFVGVSCTVEESAIAAWTAPDDWFDVRQNGWLEPDSLQDKIRRHFRLSKRPRLLRDIVGLGLHLLGCGG